MEAMKSGGLQVCPTNDSAGRPILAIMLGLRKYKTPENMVGPFIAAHPTESILKAKSMLVLYSDKVLCTSFEIFSNVHASISTWWWPRVRMLNAAVL